MLRHHPGSDYLKNLKQFPALKYERRLKRNKAEALSVVIEYKFCFGLYRVIINADVKQKYIVDEYKQNL